MLNILQLLDEDKEQIDSNLKQIKTYMCDLNSTFAAYEANIIEMESKFIERKLKDDLQIIKTNCEEIIETINDYKYAVNKVFNAIEEVDGKMK